MKDIKLTIVIPFYNVEKYIEDCLNSVYNQNISEEDYEVICVNDYSEDNSVEIVRKFKDKHSNLKIIEHTKNKMLGAARNTGLRAAQGQYIWFIDSDDFIATNILGKIVVLTLNNQLDILHFNCKRIDDDGKLSDYHACFPYNTDVISGVDYYDFDFPYWKRIVETWSRVYRREFIIENKLFFPEKVYFEDVIQTLNAILLAKRFMYLNEFVYYYRINSNSIMQFQMYENGKKLADLVRYCTGTINLLNSLEINFNRKTEIQRYYTNQILSNKKNIFYLKNSQRNSYYNRIKKIEIEPLKMFISDFNLKFLFGNNLLKAFFDIVSPPVNFLRKLKRKFIHE